MRKGQRSYFHPNSVAAVAALPACAISVWGGQVSVWQAVSGLVSLQEECESWAKPSACRPLSQQSDPHFLHFTPFSLGASQGAAGAWGFQFQSCNLQNPGKWGRWPWPTHTVSQPSRGEENQGQRTGGGEERRTQRREEPTRREEGWQEVRRCELSRETFVRQICGVKGLCCVEAGFSLWSALAVLGCIVCGKEKKMSYNIE